MRSNVSMRVIGTIVLMLMLSACGAGATLETTTPPRAPSIPTDAPASAQQPPHSP